MHRNLRDPPKAKALETPPAPTTTIVLPSSVPFCASISSNPSSMISIAAKQSVFHAADIHRCRNTRDQECVRPSNVPSSCRMSVLQAPVPAATSSSLCAALNADSCTGCLPLVSKAEWRRHFVRNGHTVPSEFGIGTNGFHKMPKIVDQQREIDRIVSCQFVKEMVERRVDRQDLSLQSICCGRVDFCCGRLACRSRHRSLSTV